MCGEHVHMARLVTSAVGSSPHVRGAHVSVQVDTRAVGIIPACAGSTCAVKGGTSYDWDHPRMCGEHGRNIPTPHTVPGSSPHVRGAPCSRLWRDCQVGIIPACAGSTPCPRARSPQTRDHPRMCGEHITGNADDAVKAGSSPHVRGAPLLLFLPTCLVGIIPACAGSTAWKIRVRTTDGDHPRMCGEHYPLVHYPKSQ